VEERGWARGRMTESLGDYRTAHHEEGLKKRNERSENRPFTEEKQQRNARGASTNTQVTSELTTY